MIATEIPEGTLERAAEATLDQLAGRRNPVVLEQAFALSLAISAKRQADALEVIAGVLTGGGDNAALHGMISNLMWEAGRSFQAGTRTDR